MYEKHVICLTKTDNKLTNKYVKTLTTVHMINKNVPRDQEREGGVEINPHPFYCRNVSYNNTWDTHTLNFLYDVVVKLKGDQKFMGLLH